MVFEKKLIWTYKITLKRNWLILWVEYGYNIDFMMKMCYDGDVGLFLGWLDELS